jgi:uncharacterized protein YbaR (Trm112 family)
MPVRRDALTHRMFIELTDHLRCPAPHDEGYLVLLPDEMRQRSVWSGELGCPQCGRILHVRDGVLDLGDAPPGPVDEVDLDGEALTVLLGLTGPGGYLVLAGAAASRASGVAAAVPGVALVAVNPPAPVVAGTGLSVLRGGMIPLKRASMRGVVLAAPLAATPHWVAEAARVVLPGLRVVGQGPAPSGTSLDIVAEAGGWWVGVRPLA